MKMLDLKKFSLNGNSHCPETFVFKILESKVLKDRKDLKYTKTIFHDNGSEYGLPREIIVCRYGYFWITKRGISNTFLSSYEEAYSSLVNENPGYSFLD